MSSEALSTPVIRILKKNFAELTKCTDVNIGLLNWLYQEDVITGTLKSEIEAEVAQEKKASKLYTHLIDNVNEDQINIFLKGLHDNKCARPFERISELVRNSQSLVHSNVPVKQESVQPTTSSNLNTVHIPKVSSVVSGAKELEFKEALIGLSEVISDQISEVYVRHIVPGLNKKGIFTNAQIRAKELDFRGIDPQETLPETFEVEVESQQTHQSQRNLPNNPIVNINDQGGLFALIINVPEDREGAQYDEAALETVLSGCNFNVMKCIDLTRKGIQKTLQDFKSALETYQGLIGGCLVAVMSHGTGNDWFKTVGGGEMELYRDVIDEFKRQKCPRLINVPKVFLVNICRGDLVDGPVTDSASSQHGSSAHSLVNPSWLKNFDRANAEPVTDSEVPGGGPSWKDMLICYASYFNCVAYREERTGTWYIQTFCKIVKNHTLNNGPTDIQSLIEQVNWQISQKQTETKAWQTPCFKNVGYFENRLYLNYKE